MQFPTSFRIKELDNGWDWPDIQSSEDGKCFCKEELEIPDEYLKGIELYMNEMHVKLCRDSAYLREDWYVNLSRMGA